MRVLVFASAALLPVAGSSAHAADARPDPVIGEWVNPEGSAKVETTACGPSLCATVVWASPEAIRKAKKAGTDPLLGVQLLSDYRHKEGGTWEGQVFVPDMNRRFFSRIEPAGANRMKLSGCVLSGLICKSTVWNRVETPTLFARNTVRNGSNADVLGR